MKRLAIRFVLLLVTLTTYSQISDKKSRSTDRHELYVNAFNAIVFKAPNVSYEYLANENISFGLGLLYKFNQSDPRERGLGSSEVAYRIFSVTPYVRRYFSKVNARGFFIESFGMLNSGVHDIRRKLLVEDDTTDTPGETLFVTEIERYNHFALGITFGGKFLMGRKGILLEIYFGMGIPGVIGQNPIGLGAVTRGGISFGYRL